MRPTSSYTPGIAGSVHTASVFNGSSALNNTRHRWVLWAADSLLHSVSDRTYCVSAVGVACVSVQPFAAMPEDRQINGFTHVFAGGYGSGYYR